jgi:hypothetical protein
MPCSVKDTAGHVRRGLDQAESDLLPLDHFRHLESRMNTRFLKFQDFFLPSFLPTLEGGDCNDGCRSNDSHNAM